MIIIKNKMDEKYYSITDVKDDVIILKCKEGVIEIPNDTKYFSMHKGVVKSAIVQYETILDPVLIYNINDYVNIDEGQEITDDEYYLYLLNQASIVRYNNELLSGIVDANYFYFVLDSKLHKINIEDCEIFPEGNYFVILNSEDKISLRYSGNIDLETHLLTEILLRALKMKK